MQRKHLEGQRHDRLTVIGLHSIRNNSTYWECKCDCGNTTVVSISNWAKTKSCGCLSREQSAENARRLSRTHGMSGTRTYEAWHSAKGRCYRRSNPSYGNYGSRGIQMCEAWINSFEQFFADMGECPDGMQLDRINNDGNYEPGNCRWVTPAENSQNRRSIKLTRTAAKAIKRSVRSAKELASRFGVSVWTIYDIRRGRRW